MDTDLPVGDDVLLFASLKAFGDLVILLSVLQRATGPGAKRIVALVGSHLGELVRALQSPVATLELPVGDRGVPALFDLKKRGLGAGWTSLLALRKAIRAVPFPPHVPLVVDRLGLRERLLGASRPVRPLVKEAGDTIYADTERCLRQAGIDFAPVATDARVRSSIVGIFPGSRLPEKTIPAELIRALVLRCREAGLRPDVFVLEGERLDGPIDGLKIVPRSFVHMMSAVQSAGRVVSADSLPAHLAERAGLPTFVVSKEPNTYWLPPEAHRFDRWTLFSTLSGDPRLEAFLETRGDRP